MEEMMLRNDVPYTVLGTKFFERKEVKDILSYLKAALNPKSQPDLKRVFDTPKKGIGKTTIAKLFAGEQLPAAASKKVQGVFDFLKTINEMLEHEPLSDVMNYILVESGLEKELKDDGEDGMVRLANISELVTLAQKYDHLPYDQNIESFFELASLSSDQDDDKKENEGVRLMTIHASKGLEFDYVFIVGLEEDLFPSKNFSGKTKSKEQKTFSLPLFYFQDGQKYDILKVLQGCSKPKLLFYATQDDFSDPCDYQKVFATLPDPKELHELNCTHDYRYSPSAVEEVNQVAKQFLLKYLHA